MNRALHIRFALILSGSLLLQSFITPFSAAAFANQPRKRNAQNRAPIEKSEREAVKQFREADAALRSDPSSTEEAEKAWVTALETLAATGSRAALSSVFDWMRRAAGSSLNRNRQWRASIEYIRRTAQKQDAAEILDLWKRFESLAEAYDLAWVLERIGAIQELASLLDTPNRERREQIALILYGHSDKLNLDQAGKILKTGLLCRFQQLWLLTRVIRASHPSSEEIAAFLERYEVVPSPELLYELRRTNSEWAAAHVRKQLIEANDSDRARLLSTLPDFDIPDRVALAEAAISDSAGEVRAAAIIALARIDDDAALRAADRLNEDDDVNVIRALQRSLGQFGSLKQMTKQLHMLVEKNLSEDEIQAAAEWIKELGESQDLRAAEPLKRVLASSSDTALREAAAEAIGKIGRREDAEALRSALQNEHEDAAVRIAIIKALGHTGESKDIETLKRFLRHSSYGGAAALSIARLNPSPEDEAEIIKSLPWAEQFYDSSSFYYALSMCGDPNAIPQIVSAVLFRARNNHYRSPNAAAYALASIDRAQSIRLLQTIAASGGADARRNAIQMLSSAPLHDASSAESIIAALSFDDESVRETAAHALGMLRARAAAQPLKNLLRDKNTSSNLREAATEALLMIDPEGLVSDRGLAKNLDEADHGLLLSAAYSLSRMPDGLKNRSQKHLLEIFNGGRCIHEKLMSASALVQYGNADAVKLLIKEARESDDPFEAAAALYPLGNLPDDGRSLLQDQMRKLSNESERENVRPFINLMLALSGDGKASKELLEDLSNDNFRNEEEEVMTAFKVLTLGAKPSSGVVESLLNIVNQGEAKENYNFVSGAAVMALGDLGDARALPALRRARMSIDPLISFYSASAMYKLADANWTLQLLESRAPELARVGIYISERFPDEAITNALVKTLSHKDWRTRGYAAYALGKRLAGKQRSSEAEATLTQLSSIDVSMRVREEAAAALRHIAYSTALESTYFEAGLLLDWIGDDRTGFSDLFRVSKLEQFRRDTNKTLMQALRSYAKGEIADDYAYDKSIIATMYQGFLDRAMTLHLMGEARVSDAFALTKKWAEENVFQGTFYEEAQYGALAILVGEMGDPRGQSLLQSARGKTREWLVRALLGIGEQKLAAASQRNAGLNFNAASDNTIKINSSPKKSLAKSAPKIESATPTQEDLTAAMGGWGSTQSLNARVDLQFEDLRKKKTHSGYGRLLWEGAGSLRFRVNAPFGPTVADLALQNGQMEFAIYEPRSEQRLLRGSIGNLQKPSLEFEKRAGAFASLRPEHLLAALRLSEADRAAVKFEDEDGSSPGHSIYLKREPIGLRIAKQEWRDDKGRLVMRVSYRNPFMTVYRGGILAWAEEVKIERPTDGYVLKMRFMREEMKIGERLPENSFRLDAEKYLPVVNLN